MVATNAVTAMAINTSISVNPRAGPPPVPTERLIPDVVTVLTTRGAPRWRIDLYSQVAGHENHQRVQWLLLARLVQCHADIGAEELIEAARCGLGIDPPEPVALRHARLAAGAPRLQVTGRAHNQAHLRQFVRGNHVGQRLVAQVGGIIRLLV